MNSSAGASRPSVEAVQSYEFGPFVVDLASYRILRDGQPLSLTPKAFDTLVVLLKHRERVVSKDELMAALWPGSFVSEDSLTQSVSVLRRALGDDPSQPRFVATAARKGYRFIASVRETSITVSSDDSDPDPLQDPGTLQHARPVEALPPSHSIASPGSTSAPVALSAPPSRFGWGWVAAPVGLALLLVLSFALRRDTVAFAPTSDRGALRFTQEAPTGTRLASGGVLSPDGRFLTFVAQGERSGRNQLWVRALDSSEARALAGTEDASRPFWSPDSQKIGFFSSGKLKRVDLGTQPPESIAATSSTTEAGGSWGANGQILFTVLRSGLYSVPASGGPVTAATTLDAAGQEIAHRWPQFLPDGQHFLYFVDSVNPQRTGTYMAAVNSPDKTRLLDVPAVYVPPASLVYIRDRVLTAQPFDLVHGRPFGSPTAIAGDATAPDVTNGAVISSSNDGLLAFGVSKTSEHLEWFSRSGQPLGAIEAPTPFRNPTLSPDNRQLLAASNAEREHRGLWVMDLERGGLTKIAADGMRPFWSPDGSRIAFTSDRTAGIADLYTRSTASREGEEEPLLRTNENKFICDWSLDGRYIVFGSTNDRTKTDLWLLPLFGDRQPTPFLQTPFNEADAQVSPDGRWIAYASDESGTWEIYVQSFPVPGNKHAVSIGGGIEPHWRRDGRELFYLAANRNLMAVDVKSGSTWQGGRPQALFRAPISGLNFYVNRYAVAADGQRFVINTSEGRGKDEPITVLVNWASRITR